MNKFKLRSISTALLVWITVLFSVQLADGQSSLFNIPTTDVVQTGRSYLETDLDLHLSSLKTGGFQSYGVVAVYGVRKRFEAGVNAYVVNAADGEAVELQPNAKWQVYENESTGVSAAVGGVVYLPITLRSGSDTFGSVYGIASKQIKGKFGPRLTGGGYALIGRDNATGSKKGFLAGFEQPVNRRLMIVADWKSGINRFGYAAAGLGFTLSTKSYLYTAWYFGNTGRGNNSLGIYYGYAF